MNFGLFLCFSVLLFFFEVHDLFNSENGEENRGGLAGEFVKDCDWMIGDNVLFSHDIRSYFYVTGTLVGKALPLRLFIPKSMRCLRILIHLNTYSIFSGTNAYGAMFLPV